MVVESGDEQEGFLIGLVEDGKALEGFDGVEGSELVEFLAAQIRAKEKLFRNGIGKALDHREKIHGKANDSSNACPSHRRASFSSTHEKPKSDCDGVSYRLPTRVVSRIEPDRYANTGFAVKDTALEVNAMIIAAMMRKAPEERLLMGFDMMATAREMVWSSISTESTDAERRTEFCRGFHDVACPW